MCKNIHLVDSVIDSSIDLALKIYNYRIHN